MSLKRDLCAVDGCGHRVHGRGLCSMHYQREYYRPGSAGIVNGLTRTERTLEFIEECITSDTDDCIEPTFKIGSEYPSVNLGDGKGDIKAGWLVLKRMKGPRPEPTDVMRHVVCGNPRCCNPRHLEWGTEKENQADMKRHGREPDRKGSNNPKAKLTEDDVRHIRKVYKKGRGYYDTGNSAKLAEDYGVTRAVILQVVNYVTWRHVE